MSVLLQVNNLCKLFPSRVKRCQGVRALAGVDLEISRGEHLALVGESGCGKTTLAKIIIGLERADSGTVLFEGRDFSRDRGMRNDFHRKVRMVFQDPFSSLDPRFTVRTILAEALCLEKKGKAGEINSKMLAVLKAVGLTGDILGRHPRAFSGGERQRIAIARALMTDPSLLILDEPVSSLDMIVQKQILDLFVDLAKKFPVTYVFISHNMRVARKISQKLAVMYEGRVVEYGATPEVMAEPRHAYTRALLSAALEYKISEE